ncbi:EscU/YscU/HrcU family type III secretion system export apparatus switch protein [Hydrogenophaga sp. YM1]|uniref:EscU/YscU/HrcU family type III secretion system export apparatus switch protein n=2 Tax=Comamonadaceae TaxID=80864 RepID=UPI00086DAC82|nr:MULTISPECIES: EscU/YscU/HrcU family type III secretion system export apparatus switch protein [unclassified Hydrogenophaga]MBN9372296.1 EscU/YscU/HrcU family type III secretion system export apparatus switch protein [Hydrogenophaga sp.]ODT33987.1 MAG: flagellar biosynthetic protein FlhB [Hydrogenophaga sp. SCN 70-13]QRR35113.1 EscU/YscU/HrcU family type III secretion system export apparatus switch protein [Hydrogenophaga sp. YM1]
MDSSSQDKNLPATPQRLKKARDDGQVARSKDLSNLAVLGGGMLVLFGLAPTGFARMRDTLAGQLRFDNASVRTPELMLQRLSDNAAQALIVYLPLGLLVIALAVVALIAAGSVALSTKPIEPKLSNISPLSGFKRLFSRQQVVETFKLVGITTVVLIVASQFIAGHAEAFATLLMRPLEAGIGQLAQWLAMGVGLLLLVIGVVAAIDVPTQRFLHKHRLRMSHDEIKREHKEAEGDPHVKSQRRARQRQLAQRQSIRAVPKADLVVMNPTHYAVALRYDDATMTAPRVIAKGTDLLALKIRDVAKANAVPVLQSPMLARALYAHAEIDQEIPGALYTAVAQVLAWVYQFKAAMNGQGRMPADPQPQVPPELDPHFKKKPQEADQ